VRAAPIVLDQPATVLWGQTVNRPIEVAADNVTIRRVKVRTGGSAAIVIRDGVIGTLIEDSEIRCTSAGTDGVAPGGYSALRVRVIGCRQAFRQTESNPATIVESSRDGKPYRGEPTTPAP